MLMDLLLKLLRQGPYLLNERISRRLERKGWRPKSLLNGGLVTLPTRLGHRVTVPADDVLAAKTALYGQHEYHELRFIQMVARAFIDPASALVDGGAHLGTFTIALSPLFRQVLAFEPNRPTRKLLEKNLSENHVPNCQIIAQGLLDQAGERRFFANKSGNIGDSRVLDGAAEAPQETAGEEVTIAVVRGDDVIPQHLGGRTVGAIKLDIQESEDLALAGMKTLIAAHLPFIFFEFSPDGEGRPRAAAIDRLLGEGYRFFILDGRRRYRGLPGQFKLISDLFLGRGFRLIEVAHLSDFPDRADLIYAVPKEQGAAFVEQFGPLVRLR